jgi:hypothetical protein
VDFVVAVVLCGTARLAEIPGVLARLSVPSGKPSLTWQVDLMFVAGVLMVISYSVNDTIVNL